MGIHKGLDLKSLPLEKLIRHYGKAGKYFYNVVRGIDERPVVPFREPKSIGAERTYEADIYDINQAREQLVEVFEIMWTRSESKNKHARTLTLKLRFSDFTTITRRITSQKILNREETKEALLSLLPLEEIKRRGVRLLGATLSNFNEEVRRSSKQMKINF